MKRALQVILTICIFAFAPVFMPGAFAMQAEPETLSPGGLRPVELTGEEQIFLFTPTANAQYSIYLFPQDADVHAELTLGRDGETVAQAEGSMDLLTCRLTAHTQYTLSLKGAGSAWLEVARETLSRSFGNPLELKDAYTKLIAREGDVHWYAVRHEEDVNAIFAAVPDRPDLGLRAWLFDETGRLLQQAELLRPGTAIMSAALEGGTGYRLRIAAVGAGTGEYRLSQSIGAPAQPPQDVTLGEPSLKLEGHTVFALEAEALPGSASQLIHLDSSDPSVVRVRTDGTLETTGSGEAVITAYAYGGLRAECEITVGHVAVESVTLDRDEIAMQEGDTARLRVGIYPENASNRGLTFVTENDRVATVDGRGMLTAVGEGTARVAVVTEDGSFTDVVFVTVAAPPKAYRALLIGEQNYASTVDKVRPGSINSVQSIESLLKTMSFADGTFETATLMDAPRDSVIAAIRNVFQDAQEGDVSLIYITCHGFYRAGMTFFVMADGSVLSARDLERELRKIPGGIILLADCCGSGGLLGEGGTTDDILDGITSVFHGTTGAPAVSGSKYRVIASALLDQDSYRISFSDDSETGMATVFARALCDGAGWSIDRNAQSAMNADANYDGEITLNELGSYMHRRVNWYLNLAGGYVQNVRTYPEGDGFVLFSRTGLE